MKLNKIFFNYLILIFILGFIFNYIWESLHYVLYICKVPLGKCSLITSLIDALIVILLYIGGVFVYLDSRWINSFNKNKVISLSAASFLIAIIIEIQGVYLFNKWGYSELMPVVFGIGLSPLLQMIFIPLLIFYLVGKVKI